MANLGALTNRGFELSLNANLINHDNFAWNSSGTFSFNRRKIKHLYGDVEEVKDDNGNVIGYKEADDYENKWFIGHDTEQIWDYERDGVWQLGEEEEASKYGNSRVTSSILTKTGMEYWIRKTRYSKVTRLRDIIGLGVTNSHSSKI